MFAALGWIGYGVAYLSLGYVIGKIANAEYFNNTATEKLGIFRKIQRVLLFPFMYHEWEKRVELYWGNDTNEGKFFPLLLRLCASAYAENSDAKARQRYCHTVMIFWPLKIIFSLTGFAQIAFFVILSILKVMAACIELPFIGLGELKNYLKSESANSTDTTLEKLEKFKVQELEPHKGQLLDTHINLRNRVDALEKKIKEGGELLLALANHKDSFAHKRCALLVQKLQLIHDKESEKLNDVKNILFLIQSKESELDDIVKLNKFYQAVGELEVDTMRDNEIVMQATLAAMETCRGLFKQAHDLETDMMCKADMPLDDIVKQMHESDKKEESLSRTASNVVPISRK